MKYIAEFSVGPKGHLLFIEANSEENVREYLKRKYGESAAIEKIALSEGQRKEVL